MEVLKCENLKKYYGNHENTVKALDGVDLSVEKGEFVAIVGSSGSGKSTLLHLFGGLDEPTSGKVFVDGKEIYQLKKDALCIFRRRKIGFVFQSYNLVPVLNVYENVVLPVELDGDKVDTAYIKEVIGLLGLNKKLESLPSQLSGGQQQRVAIARALASNPKVLLCDEPTSALDPLTTRSILKLLREINHTLGVTIVIITHEIGVVRSICNKVAVIDAGEIAESGLTKEVFAAPQSQAAKQLLDNDF